MNAFPALAEAEGRLKAKQDELGKVFAAAGPELDFDKVVKSGLLGGEAKTSRDVVGIVAKLNDEMDEIGVEVDNLTKTKKAADAHNAGFGRESGDGATGATGAPGYVERKSFGELFTKSKAFAKAGQSELTNIDMGAPASGQGSYLKTLFETAAGWLPETTRTGRVVDFATTPIQVVDIIPQTTTAQTAVVYMEETTFTNNAVEKAEGAAFGEAALALTEKSSSVRKIPVFIPVTDEQFEDESQVRGYLNNRLPFMIRQRLDSQLLVGNGTAPNLRGILNVVGIQTQAKGADPTPDAVYKGIVLCRTGTGQAMPNAAVFNPLDWQDIRLLRTADGLYIWGNPSDAGPMRIWGLSVVEAQALTAGTGLVGDFANFSELAVRRGMDVQVSNSHSTFFTEGKQAVRADIRVAFVVYRPAAFCTITGI